MVGSLCGGGRGNVGGNMGRMGGGGQGDTAPGGLTVRQPVSETLQDRANVAITVGDRDERNHRSRPARTDRPYRPRASGDSQVQYRDAKTCRGNTEAQRRAT